jgi:hypothetical protein
VNEAALPDALPVTFPVTFPVREAVIVPAEKLPLASLATIALTELVLEAVVALFTTLPTVEMVASLESTIPALALMLESVTTPAANTVAPWVPVTFPTRGPVNEAALPEVFPVREAVIVPAEKLPLTSLATIALTVLALVAVVAELATLPTVEIVASLESTIPALVFIIELMTTPGAITVADCAPVTFPARDPVKEVVLPEVFPTREAVIKLAVKLPPASLATIDDAVLLSVAVVALLATFPELISVLSLLSDIEALAFISPSTITPLLIVVAVGGPLTSLSNSPVSSPPLPEPPPCVLGSVFVIDRVMSIWGIYLFIQKFSYFSRQVFLGFGLPLQLYQVFLLLWGSRLISGLLSLLSLLWGVALVLGCIGHLHAPRMACYVFGIRTDPLWFVFSQTSLLE